MQQLFETKEKKRTEDLYPLAHSYLVFVVVVVF